MFDFALSHYLIDHAYAATQTNAISAWATPAVRNRYWPEFDFQSRFEDLALSYVRLNRHMLGARQSLRPSHLILGRLSFWSWRMGYEPVCVVALCHPEETFDWMRELDRFVIVNAATPQANRIAARAY